MQKSGQTEGSLDDPEIDLGDKRKGTRETAVARVAVSPYEDHLDKASSPYIPQVNERLFSLAVLLESLSPASLITNDLFLMVWDLQYVCLLLRDTAAV